MSKKHNKKSKPGAHKPRESVFQEAWENMSEDAARVMPEFLVKHLQKGKGRLWVMIVVTLVELVILGIVGKFVYDWLVN